MAALSTEGASGFGSSVADEGLTNVVKIVPEFDPEKEVTYDDLQLFTNNFSGENWIVRTQFGMLYRGKIPQGWRGIPEEKDVTVKVWEPWCYLTNGDTYHVKPENLLARVKDEIRFMGLPLHQKHPHVGKVAYYCFEVGKLGVAYDLNPLDSIHNLIMFDKDKFGWRNRVKVALGLARFLKICHRNMPQYLVRNLSAAHVLVDKDFNPVVVDFAMILGGGLGDGRFTGLPAVLGSHGYEDINVVAIGMWTAGNDVFALGVVLLELILQSTSAGLTKALRCPHLVFIHEVAYGLYVGEQARAKERESKFSYLKKLCLCAHPRAEEREFECSLVYKKLQADPDFDAS